MEIDGFDLALTFIFLWIIVSTGHAFSSCRLLKTTAIYAPLFCWLISKQDIDHFICTMHAFCEKLKCHQNILQVTIGNSTLEKRPCHCTWTCSVSMGKLFSALQNCHGRQKTSHLGRIAEEGVTALIHVWNSQLNNGSGSKFASLVQKKRSPLGIKMDNIM